MYISIFIRGKEIHISTTEFEKVYSVEENRHLADRSPVFLKDAIMNNADKNIEGIIYSSWPHTFTTSRIITSIVKGMVICDNNIEITGVSSFLVYLALISANTHGGDGIISIPTMRGDYFTCEYHDNKLDEMKISSIHDLENTSLPIYYETDFIFKGQNLASIQKQILNSTISHVNLTYISDKLDIHYSYTPIYKY
jgi:tRNA A37 threonylcarbamoyladenosine modification protein TsaB